jgi:hypothetical protein
MANVAFLCLIWETVRTENIFLSITISNGGTMLLTDLLVTSLTLVTTNSFTTFSHAEVARNLCLISHRLVLY